MIKALCRSPFENANSYYSDKIFEGALGFTIEVYRIAIHRSNAVSMLSFIHIILTFVRSIARAPIAIEAIGTKFPWALTATMLNTLNMAPTGLWCHSEHYQIHKTEALPEDSAMRGLVYGAKEEGEATDKDKGNENIMQLSTQHIRRLRILSLGMELAGIKGCLEWDNRNGKFDISK